MSFTRRLSRERFVAEPAMRKFELLLTRSDCAAGLDVICILHQTREDVPLGILWNGYQNRFGDKKKQDRDVGAPTLDKYIREQDRIGQSSRLVNMG